MELRQLRYFLAVAEQLHFGHAAAGLSVSQATVSEQVRQLEAELGFPLLARTSRHVSLTPAGATFRQGAQRAIDQLAHAAAASSDVAVGRLGRLRLGAVGSALSRTIPAILRALRSAAPDLAVTVSQLSTTAQLTALSHGDLDAGFVRGARPTPTLSLRPLAVEPLAVVASAGHRLATSAAIDLGQLADDTLVIWPRVDAPDFYDQITGLCAQHGFRPYAILHAPDTPSQMAMVSAGLGVSIQPSSFSAVGHHGNLTLIPLTAPAPTSTLQLAWPTPSDNPAVARLIAVAAQ